MLGAEDTHPWLLHETWRRSDKAKPVGGLVASQDGVSAPEPEKGGRGKKKRVEETSEVSGFSEKR